MLLLVARQTDIQDPDFVSERIAVDAERGSGAAEISRRPPHGADDVLLLELLLREIERDPVSEKLVDDLLELPIQVHVILRKSFRRERRRAS